jgi:predicted PurR-regulated permease PerM
MALFALIPLVGTSVIWFPASIILLISGQTFNGIGLLLYGIFVISLADNFIRPVLIGSKTKINSLLILFSVFGGLKLFGLIGIFLGPIIIAFLLTFIEIYKIEFKSELSKD